VKIYINTAVKVNPISVRTSNAFQSKVREGTSTIKSSVRKSRTTLYFLFDKY